MHPQSSKGPPAVPAPPPRTAAPRFKTWQKLQEWLEGHGVDVKKWSTSTKFKSCERLWEEIEKGESELVFENGDATPKRIVEVMNVRVQRGDLVLTETYQQQREGSFRLRFVPYLAEKMRSGEDFAEAARRGMIEEVG